MLSAKKDLQKLRDARQAISQKYPTISKTASASFVILKWLFLIAALAAVLLVAVALIMDRSNRTNKYDVGKTGQGAENDKRMGRLTAPNITNAVQPSHYTIRLSDKAERFASLSARIISIRDFGKKLQYGDEIVDSGGFVDKGNILLSPTTGGKFKGMFIEVKNIADSAYLVEIESAKYADARSREFDKYEPGVRFGDLGKGGAYSVYDSNNNLFDLAQTTTYHNPNGLTLTTLFQCRNYSFIIKPQSQKSFCLLFDIFQDSQFKTISIGFKITGH